MALAAPGVGSNLDVNSIVSQLMTLERRPITLLDAKEAAYQARLSAYGTLRGALSSLQSAISGLDTPSRFDWLTATSPDTSVLTKTGSATLTVAGDTAGVTKSVEAFVKAYNELNSTIATLTRFDPKTQKGGSLVGDGAARTIRSGLRNALASALSTVSDGEFSVLRQIGVSFQRDGSLALDSAKLRTALTENFDDVAHLFASVGRSTDSPSTGALASWADGINKSIEEIARSRENLSHCLEGVETRLRAQFAALDTLISMTSTSTFLTQQLAALQRLNR